jgi:integrase
MAVIVLTDLIIRTLKPGIYFDRKTPAFGIWIGKRRKSWIVLKQPNRTKVTIGHYPDLALSVARKKALITIGSPYEPVVVPSFGDALQEFLGLDRWKESSKYELSRNIKHYFKSAKKLDEITHKEIADCIEGIEAKSQAAHTLKDLKTFFNWCVPRYITRNPCAGLKGQRYRPRQRVLTDDELRCLWNTEIAAPRAAMPIIRLLILTGARKGEVSALKWDDVSDVLTFPETKSGRTHVIPCTPMMKKIIEARTKSSPYVFPGRTGGPFNGFNDPKKELDRLISGFVIHDIRRTFASNWQKLGVRIEITEAALGHVGTRGGIVGVYQTYSYAEELKTSYALWEERLKNLLAGAESTPKPAVA